MAFEGSLLYRRVYDVANYRLRLVAGGRFAHRCRPTWISFLLTERCNARCVHCDIWKNRGREDSPSTAQWKQALTDLRGWIGPAHVCLTGGEALLVRDTPEILRHGSDAGHLMELLTHGYWGDQSRIEAAVMARPWRVTFSLDGVGSVHSEVRGRAGFFDRTRESIDTVMTMRKRLGVPRSILLKTVVMRQNLGELTNVARFAAEHDLEVLYQPIVQNYNTPDDAEWFTRSANWPDDPQQAVAVVEELLDLKRRGLPIVNTIQQLEVMIPYFRDPSAWGIATRAHTAHERRFHCSALELIQVQSNGDVRVCASAPPVGNIKEKSLPEIWRSRPAWWQSGCCLERRLTEEERTRLADQVR